MSKLPQGHISTILAQKKLSSNGDSNSGSNAAISDDYNFNFRIKGLPNFNTPDSRNEYGLSLSEIASMLARKTKRVYERHLAKERGEELLAKAKEYEIPYDLDTLDIITLRDKVEEFESAIELASQYGIDWKTFGYDLLAIEQEIADAQVAERDYLNYTRNQFLTTRGIVA